jgi:DNA-binding transcriptional ArsR family regulator
MEREERAQYFGRIAEVLKAMAEPLRLQLLSLLLEGERCVGELVRETAGSQANVSKHLGVLRQAGLVSCRRDGHSIHYSIDDPALFEICGVVGRTIERRLADEQRLMSQSRQLMAPDAKSGVGG